MAHPENGESDLDSLAYGDALIELEGILNSLESGDVDVDGLAQQVTRASELIAHCRQRLASVEEDVDTIVANLDRDSE